MSLAQSTVHLVDDNAEFREAVQQMLARAELPSRSYPTAEEFLSTCGDVAPGPQCLVSDVVMPGIDGLALMEQLVARGIRMPTIFVTGCANISLAVTAIKRGAIDFLEKPLQLDVLQQSIVKALVLDRQWRLANVEQAGVSERLTLLSQREAEVKDLLLAGHNAKQIAMRLNICPKTAMKHRSRILEKMGVESIVQLLRLLMSDPSDSAGMPTSSG